MQLGDRTDEDGRTWLTADSQLSALAAGDDLVELAFTAAGTTKRILTAIRITR